MSIIVIGNNSNNAHGLEFPQIELRSLGGVLQCRIVGKGISHKLAKLNPRLVLFRRVKQKKDTSGARKYFPSKVQYVITRPHGVPGHTIVQAIEFVHTGQANSEGWITLRFVHDNAPVTAPSILNMFSFMSGSIPIYRRRSRESVSIDVSASNYFAQYYGIGFACDNPDNSEAMNRRGQNLLYRHIALFKAGVFRDSSNKMNFFFRIKTN